MGPVTSTLFSTLWSHQVPDVFVTSRGRVGHQIGYMFTQNCIKATRLNPIEINASMLRTLHCNYIGQCPLFEADIHPTVCVLLTSQHLMYRSIALFFIQMCLYWLPAVFNSPSGELVSTSHNLDCCACKAFKILGLEWGVILGSNIEPPGFVV